jgi:hypothetical protein
MVDTTHEEEKDAIKYTISTALYSTCQGKKMLRSPLTSKTGQWEWEDLPDGHCIVGRIKTKSRITGRYRVLVTLFELNADGKPIRWLCEDTDKKTLIDFHEDVASPSYATPVTVRVKWRVEEERFTRKARTSPTLVGDSHHPSVIPGELEIYDRAELVTTQATPSYASGA